MRNLKVAIKNSTQIEISVMTSSRYYHKEKYLLFFAYIFVCCTSHRINFVLDFSLYIKHFFSTACAVQNKNAKLSELGIFIPR